MKTRLTTLVLLAVFIGFYASRARAASVSGRFTTAVYSFERAFQDTATRGALRAYQTGRIKLERIGSRPELSFRTYGRVSHDFQDDRTSDPAYRLYHAYFQWKDTGERFRVSVGRQTVFAGVGVGRIDGGRVRLSGYSRIRLDVYGGALVYGGHEGLRSPGRASLIGAHVVLPDLAGSTIGVSAFRRSRRVDAYTSTSRAIEGLPGLEIRPGEVEQQMIGLDVSRPVGRSTVNARWDLSTPNGLRTRRFETDVRYRHAGWTLSGGYVYRTPYVDQNSIFAVFTQSANQEVVLRVNRRHNRHLSVYSEVSFVDYDGDDGVRLNVGVNVLNGTIGYTRRTGYAGSSDGFHGVVRYRLNRSILASASTGLTRFRTYSGTDVRSRVFANTLGLSLRPSRYVNLSVQGQSLSQRLQSTAADPFAGAGHDLRVFLSASVWFWRGGR